MLVTVLIGGNRSGDQSLPSNSGRQIINRMFAITRKGQVVLNVRKKSGMTGRVSMRRRHLSRALDVRRGSWNWMSSSTAGRPCVHQTRACGGNVHGARGTASGQPDESVSKGLRETSMRRAGGPQGPAGPQPGLQDWPPREPGATGRSKGCTVCGVDNSSRRTGVHAGRSAKGMEEEWQ